MNSKFCRRDFKACKILNCDGAKLCIGLRKKGRFGRMAEEKKQVPAEGTKGKAEEKKEVSPREAREAAEKKKLARGEAKKPVEEKKEVSPKEAKEVAAEKEEAAPRPEKKKKIKELSLQEIEEKLKLVEATMGGTSSKYAQHLIQRRDELLQGKRGE